MTSFSHSSAVEAAFVLFLATLLGCGPSDGSKEYEKGMAAYKAGDLLHADRFFARAVERAPGNVDALVAATRVKIASGDVAAAASLVERAETLAGADPDVISLVAEVAWLQKRYDKASEYYLRMTDEAFDATVRSCGWTGYAIVARASERPGVGDHVARCALMRAVRLDRNNASARYHLGMLYRDGFCFLDAALEQFLSFARLSEIADKRVQTVQEDVIKQLRDEISERLTSMSGAASRNAASAAEALVRAEKERKSGRMKAAQQFYEAAYKADPLSYQAALGLAKIWEQDRTPAGQNAALRYYQSACELNASAIQTFLAAGKLAAKLGHDASAADFFSRAVAASPQDITAIDGLIRALRKTKAADNVASAAVYQKYRESIPVRRAK